MRSSNYSDKLSRLLSVKHPLNYEQILALILIFVSTIVVITNPGIAALGFLLFAISSPIIFRYPKIFFIILIATKMVINSLYNVAIFGDVNVLQIIGVAVPSFLILFMLIRRHNILAVPFSRTIVVFLMFVALSSALTMYGLRDISVVEKILRLLNGLTCYFAIPLIFKTEKDINHLFKAWLVSVSFPLVIALYQIFTSQLHMTVTPSAEGLYRIAGVYHDASSLALSGILFIILLFFFHRSLRLRFTRIPFYILLFLSIFITYRTYSRWGTISVALFLILFSIYYRRLAMSIIAACVVFLIFFYERSGVYERIETEMIVREKFGDNLVFTGRVGLWQKNFQRYMDYGIMQKVLGYSAIGNPHNDFVRMILDYGFLGLLIYVSLLVGILLKLLRNLKRDESHLTSRLIFISLLSHVAFIVISFGLTPSLWTDYQWFHWGLLGITFTRIRDSERKKKVKQKAMKI